MNLIKSEMLILKETYVDDYTVRLQEMRWNLLDDDDAAKPNKSVGSEKL